MVKMKHKALRTHCYKFSAVKPRGPIEASSVFEAKLLKLSFRGHVIAASFEAGRNGKGSLHHLTLPEG